ncbi:MAG TPA: MFS transporter [Acidimicrobiales bacterium]|nr:MFS transporter [Acidimicrobiales bacterium]
MSGPGDVAPAATRNRRVIFATVAVALFMASVDGTIVATALPNLIHHLHAPITWSVWSVTAYQLGQAVAMPVAGRVSDAWGRRPVLLASVAAFVVTSAACGLAPDIFVLIVFRVLQALAGGAFMPSATGVVSDIYGDKRDRAVGLFTSIFPLGALVGPILGGLIVTYWDWRGIFFVNVPVGLALLVVGWRVLPAGGSTGPRRRIDWLGAALLGALLLGLMLSLVELGNGAPAWLVITVAAAGVAAATAFFRRQTRVEDPIIAVTLLRRPVFAALNTINLAFGACAMGFSALIPLLGESAYHLRAVQAGSLLSARAVLMIGMAAVTSMALPRVGYRLPMAAGLLVTAASAFLVGVRPPAGIGVYTWLAAGSALMGVGVGLAAPSSNNAVLDLVPGDIASVAGLRGTFRQVGSIIGVSTATVVMAQSLDQGRALAEVFRFLALVLVAVTPLVLAVPRRRDSVRLGRSAGGAQEPVPAGAAQPAPSQ